MTKVYQIERCGCCDEFKTKKEFLNYLQTYINELCPSLLVYKNGGIEDSIEFDIQIKIKEKK